MRLEDALNQSTNCQAFNHIFECHVKVQVDTLWGVDSVSVEGYEETVTTDLIARRISQVFSGAIEENQEEAAIKLSIFLKAKVFKPLRNRIQELDRSSCMWTLSYKIRNFARIGWTPEDQNLTAGYFVLKHSMCVMFLDKSF